MDKVLTSREKRAMERIITQIAKEHGVTETEVRRDMTELIAETVKAAQADPVARELWKSCPRAGKIPTPEEFIFWASGRVADRITADGVDPER